MWTQRRSELTVAGTVNPDVRTLEFIANARDGIKAYETAVTLDTDAITFNAALLLIGLDKSRSKNVPTTALRPGGSGGRHRRDLARLSRARVPARSRPNA